MQIEPDATRDPGPLTPALAAALRGRFVVFDGPDGSGKTTQLRRLASACEASGLGPCVVREPGGTEIGERIRGLLLGDHTTPPTTMCEMLLFMASRAELVQRQIAPALSAGRPVLSDRYVSSTLAYQGAAGGLPVESIMAVASVACAGVMPALTVVFDIDPATASRRTTGTPRRGQRDTGGQQGLFADAIEAKGVGFQRLVREGYLEQARRWPDHYAVIDASGDEQKVWVATLRTLAERLG